MHILTIRGELNYIRPSRAERLLHRVAAQIWPRVTSSSLDISKENPLISTCESRKDLLNAITEVDQETLLSIFESW
jgi:hypothetical protein